MNHVYRTVFNRVLGVWQAVAETATSRGTGGSTRARRRRSAALTLGLALPAAMPAWAADLPVGGSIVAGSGSITTSGSTLTVTQDSSKLVTNWQSFDIGAANTVKFVQPSNSSIALNRVLGTDGTRILGHLDANGQVWLLNPNGVLFGKGAQVNVGGLVASTLDLSDADFLAGKYTFKGNGGSVVNQASLNAGYVALLGEQVRNEGVITANLGMVALAGGNQVTLDFNGDKLLNVQVDQGALKALVENHGLIQADGGLVVMTARARDALLDTAVNNTGIIRARTLENREGRILLLGDMESGSVGVGGTLDASAPHGGNGGFIETSAAHVKIADNAAITTKAAGGSSGQWLIDPVDFTIAASGGDMTGAALSNALSSGNVKVQSTSGTSGTAGDVNVNDTVSWSANTLTLNAQNNINIRAQMNGSGTAGLALEYGQGALASGNTSAYYVNAPVNLASTGNFSTKQGSDGTVVNYTIITSLGAQGSTTGTDLQGIQGSLSGNYVLGADIDARATAGWNSGQGFAPLGDTGNLGRYFSGRLDGLGHVIDGLTIDNPNSNVGLMAFAQNAAIANLGLTNASITGLDSVGGFAGVGVATTIRNSYITGAVAGEAAVGGFVGRDIVPRGSLTLDSVYSTASVTATGVGDGSPVLASIVGGLVGQGGLSITNSYSTGAVSGGNYVGGLVGVRFSGTMSNSYFAGTIAENGTAYALGALVGELYGVSITNSYWNADTAGTVGIGRISHGTVTNATGLTTAQMRDAANWAGFNFTSTPGGSGWVMVGSDGGLNNANGTVLPMLASEWSPLVRNAHQLQLMALDKSASYTLGRDIDASATNGGAHDVWLASSFTPVGSNTGAFTGSFDGQNHTIAGLTVDRPAADYQGLFGYASGATLSHVTLSNASVSGNNDVGALLGYGDAGTAVNNAHASGSVNATSVAGGLIGGSAGSVSDSDAEVSVTGANKLGGLVGDMSGGTVTNSHAKGNVTGTASYVGGLAGTASSTITNSYATGAVHGQDYVGGLAGASTASSAITNSYAEGDVTGRYRVGGLVGEAHGAITGSHASGKATGTGDYVGGLVGATDAAITDSDAQGAVRGVNDVGGLAGWSSAAISGSYATGDVTATGWRVGGLAGNASGALSDSYASGAVQGAAYVGGLIGQANGNVSDSHATGSASTTQQDGYVGGLIGRSGNTAVVTNSYATGEVTNTHPLAWVAGGLIGESNGAVSNSYATGNVSGIRNVVGGLIGRSRGAVSNSYATGSASGESLVGGLVGSIMGGSITNSYASGAVSGASLTGGLVGNFGGGTVSGSYWNTETTHQATSAGGAGAVGKTTAEMQQLATFAGWSIDDVGGTGATWRIYEGSTAPLLRSFLKPLTVSATPDYDGSGAALAYIGSATLSGVPAGDPHLYGSATVTPGNQLTLSSTQAGQYTATSNAKVSGLYSDQQGYDILTPAASRTIATPGSAAGDIQLPNAITWSSGTLEIDTAGAVTTGTSGINTTAVNGDAFRLTNGLWRQNSATLAGFAVNDFQLAGGTFLRGTGGDGSSATPYLLADVYGLQGMASTSLLASNFALANDIDASGTAQWNAGAGFVPVGTDALAFTGRFDGENHAIAGLTVDRPAANYQGLFGYASGATLSNITLSNASVNGNKHVGALLGHGDATTAVSNAHSSGTMTAAANGVGGLVGLSAGSIDGSDSSATVNGTLGVGGLVGFTVAGSISNSSASGNVSGTGYVGGLIGQSIGSISGSRATGNVTASNLFAGGLVGYAAASTTLSNSHATGAVNANEWAGGLVGYSYQMTLSGSYATGDVSGHAGVGGLVGGLNSGSIAGSYASGKVTGADVNVGGLLGALHASSISDSYATGSAQGRDQVGGLVGWVVPVPGNSITNSYATGRVTATAGSVAGGLVGYSEGAAAISNSFWNTETTLQASAIGSNIGGSALANVDGKTTAQMKQLATFAGSGWDIDDMGGTGATWRIYDGQTAPLLRSFLTALTVTAESGNKTYDGTTRGLGVSYTATPDASLLLGTVAATMSGKDAGTQTVSASGLYSTQQGYDIRYASGTIDVQKAALTISGTTAAGKPYDGTTDATITPGTLTGFVGSETVTIASATGVFDSKNAGTRSATASYTLADGSNGGLASNYTLADTTGHAAVIDKAVLAINGTTAADRTYDGTAVATIHPGTLAGLVGSETLGVTATGTFDSKNAGARTATAHYTLANGANGGLASNYSLADTSGHGATIAKAPLTLSTSDVSRVYDGSTSAAGTAVVTAGTLYGGDDISGGNFAYTDKNAGSGKTVTVSGVTVSDGNSGNNYAVSYANNTTSTITRALLAIAGTAAAGKAYDGTTAAAITPGTLSGLVGSETLGVTATGTFDSKNAGSRTATAHYALANGTNGGLASNYTLADTTGHAAVIDKAVLAISGTTATSRTFDGTTVATIHVGTLAGLIGSETLGVAATGSFDSKNAGARTATAHYTLADGSNGGLASNYALADTTGHAALIDKAVLTISGTTAADRTYDGTAVATLTPGSLSGLVGSETLGVAASGTFDSRNAGVRTATAHYTLADGGNGGLASNYTLADTSGHAATIAKAPLTLSTSDVSRVYDGSTAATGTAVVTAGTLYGSDGISGGIFDFTDNNAGTNKAVAVSAVTVSDGNGGGNYAVSYANNTSSSIAKAALTVTANDAAKTYDGVAWTGGNNVRYSGFVNGETAVVLGGSLTYGGSSQGAVEAGAYGITPAGLTATNYALTFRDGMLTISPAPQNPGDPGTSGSGAGGMPGAAVPAQFAARYAGAVTSAQADPQNLSRDGTPLPTQPTNAQGGAVQPPQVVVQNCGMRLPAALAERCE